MTEPLTRDERRRALLIEHCYSCRSDDHAGVPWSETLADHERCHGWWHCDEPEYCCGPCGCCYVTARVDSDLAEWEATVLPPQRPPQVG